MWENRRGFTLIEIIILIALIGILAGSSVALIGHIRYANTKKVAEEVDTALSRLRLDTMSRNGRQYLYIYYLEAGEGYYMKLLDEDKARGGVSVGNGPDDALGFTLDSNGIRLCGNSVEIWMSGGGGKPVQVNGDGYLCVAYTKNGLFQSIVTNTAFIEIRGRGTYKIQLDLATGRHYFE